MRRSYLLKITVFLLFYKNFANQGTSCPAGQQPKTETDNSCSDCATGCSLCSGGNYKSDTDDLTCQSCPAGTYSNPGATSCINCPAGTFTPITATALSDCEDCPQGTISSASSPNTECVPCSPGTVVSGTECVDCPAGTFSFSGWIMCINCSNGSISSPKSGSCTLCAAGTYAHNSTTCVDCPAGYYSNSGAISCTLCPAGTSCPPLNDSNSTEALPNPWIQPTLSPDLQTSIPLTKSQYGYYTLNFTALIYSSYETFPLMIDLISSQSILFNASYTCYGFSGVYISPNWVLLDTDDSVLWPLYDLTVTNYNNSINMSLDGSVLNGMPIQPAMPTTCYYEVSDSYLTTYGQGTYGTVGFGYAVDNLPYFLNSAYYLGMSIYINSTTQEGTLTLGKPNFSYAANPTPLYSLPLNVSNSWGTENISSYTFGTSHFDFGFGSWVSPMTIAWDLNCPTICISSGFSGVISQTLQLYGSFQNCQGSPVVTCDLLSGKNVSSLPSFYFTPGNQTTGIAIPPQIYIQNYEDHLQNNANLTLIFNFDVIPVTNANVNDDYESQETIYFGALMMSYYFTVFNLTHNTIDLYIPFDAPETLQYPTQPTQVQNTSNTSTSNTNTSTSTDNKDPVSNPTDGTSVPINNTNPTSNSSDKNPTETTQNSTNTSNPNSNVTPISDSNDKSPTDNDDPLTSNNNPNQVPTPGGEKGTADPTNSTSSAASSDLDSSKVSPVVWIVPIVVIFVLAVGYFLYRRHYKRKKAEGEAEPDPNSNESSMVMPEYVPRNIFAMPSR